MKSTIVNTTKKPFVPNGWKIEKHDISLGKIDVTKIELHSEEEQKTGYIKGEILRERLEGKPILNANVLDHLLAHPHLIPEEWKDKYVFFWGTIYRARHGRLCVRYLFWYGGRWYWYCFWLGIDWGGRNPAALLARLTLDTKNSVDPLPLTLTINGYTYERK